jgi:hypothetical protein
MLLIVPNAAALRDMDSFNLHSSSDRQIGTASLKGPRGLKSVSI